MRREKGGLDLSIQSVNGAERENDGTAGSSNEVFIGEQNRSKTGTRTSEGLNWAKEVIQRAKFHNHVRPARWR